MIFAASIICCGKFETTAFSASVFGLLIIFLREAGTCSSYVLFVTNEDSAPAVTSIKTGSIKVYFQGISLFSIFIPSASVNNRSGEPRVLYNLSAIFKLILAVLLSITTFPLLYRLFKNLSLLSLPFIFLNHLL